MRKLALVAALAAITGCATPTTGVVPTTGEGTYTVTRQGEGFWVTTAELRTAALVEAGQYCEAKKQPIKVIHVKEIPAGAFGRWPEAEVVFACSK